MDSVFFNFVDKEKVKQKLASGEFPFSQNLFWDADVEDIDIHKNKRYIVERVVTRGFLDDFYTLLQLYSIKEIKEALVKSKELDSKTANFCSYFFNIPKSCLHVSSFYG